MSDSILYTVNDKGFVADVDGYLCFIWPEVDRGQLNWRWVVQSGGGWTHRGGAHVETHASGESFKAKYAEQDVVLALQKLNVDI